MIKKAKITEAFQVNLYCDKCGKRMEYAGMSHNRLENVTTASEIEIKYHYTCECGHKETSDTRYPCQIVFFDEANAEEVIQEGGDA